MITALLLMLSLAAATIATSLQVAERRRQRWERELCTVADRYMLPSAAHLPAWEDGWRSGFQRALAMVEQGWNREDLRRWIDEERAS